MCDSHKKHESVGDLKESELSVSESQRGTSRSLGSGRNANKHAILLRWQEIRWKHSALRFTSINLIATSSNYGLSVAQRYSRELHTFVCFSWLFVRKGAIYSLALCRNRRPGSV